jgi:hypothetical protein
MKQSPKKTGQIILTVVALTAGAVLSILLYKGLVPAFSAIAAENDSQLKATSLAGLSNYDKWLKPAFMFVIMLAGMFFNQIFENLKMQKEAGETQANVLRLFTDGIKGITFWMAFFVSPLIFYATYYMVDKLPDGAVGYLYAFQGGFFWYNIFNRFELKSKKQALQAPVV